MELSPSRRKGVVAPVLYNTMLSTVSTVSIEHTYLVPFRKQELLLPHDRLYDPAVRPDEHRLVALRHVRPGPGTPRNAPGVGGVPPFVRPPIIVTTPEITGRRDGEKIARRRAVERAPLQSRRSRRRTRGWDV